MEQAERTTSYRGEKSSRGQALNAVNCYNFPASPGRGEVRYFFRVLLSHYPLLRLILKTKPMPHMLELGFKPSIV